MRLWGKVAKIALLLMAAGCALMAMFMPEDRWQASLAAIVAIVVAVFGVPALVRLFSSFSGDEEVLANGVAGSATITALAPTRWHFNDYPIFRFSLSVEASGASYPVVDPKTDIEIVDGCWSTPLDPRMSPQKKEAQDYTDSRAICYAVRPFSWRERFPKVSRSSRELFESVVKKYKGVLPFPGS
jgi:hypothetical protein